MEWISFNSELIAKHSTTAFTYCVNCYDCDECPCKTECKQLASIRSSYNKILKSYEDKLKDYVSSVNRNEDIGDFDSIVSSVDKLDFALRDGCKKTNCKHCYDKDICESANHSAEDIYHLLVKINKAFHDRPAM